MKAFRTVALAAGLCMVSSGAALAHGYYRPGYYHPAGRVVVRPYVVNPPSPYYWGSGYYAPGFGYYANPYISPWPYGPYVSAPYRYYGPAMRPYRYPYAPYSYWNPW